MIIPGTAIKCARPMRVGECEVRGVGMYCRRRTLTWLQRGHTGQCRAYFAPSASMQTQVSIDQTLIPHSSLASAQAYEPLRDSSSRPGHYDGRSGSLGGSRSLPVAGGIGDTS